MAARDVASADPQAILELVHRLVMGQLDRVTTLALAASLEEPDLASEDPETVEAAIAHMNARVRARPPQDFKRELEEAAARMASRARPAVPPAQPVAPPPRQPRARAPRARRVGARASARSPGSRAGDDDPDPALVEPGRAAESGQPFRGIEPPEVEAIPAELRELDQWVLWRFEDRDDKRTKAPWQARNPRARASSTNPETWATFAEAVEALERGHGDGLGFVFTESDPFVGVDLDGELSEAEQGAIMAALSSYAERSVSGAGHHVLVRAELPAGGRHPPGIGVFDRGRYFVVTGDHVPDTPTTIEARQAELEGVLDEYLPKREERAEPAEPQPVDVDDEELLERARRARNGADFDRLWRGDTSGYPSHSEADLALCSRLAFWTGRDAGRVDRLFRASGLMRPKWDERRGDSTYGAQTIDEAIARCRDVYTPKTPKTPKRPAVPPASLEEAPAPFAIEVRTTRELAALPDPPGSDEVLGPLVVRRQRLVLGGHTGEGKTTFALAIIYAVAFGSDFLEWTAKPGRVLVIDAEQGLRTIKRRIAEAGLEECDAVDYARVPDGLALDRNVQHVAAVEELLEAGGYDVVVADPLYKLHSGDSNAEREAVDLMRRIDAWRERYGFALILPVHCRKPVPGSPFSIHDLFGSSAYVRGAEVVLGLQRVSDGYSRLHFLKDRDGDLPIGDVWGLLFDREHGFRRDPKDTEERDPVADVVAFLAEAQPSTVPEIARGVGMADKTVRDLLRSDPGLFRLATPSAGRHPNAKVWTLVEATRPGPETRRDDTGQEALPYDSSGSPVGPLGPRGRDELGRPLVPEAGRPASDDDGGEVGEDGLAWR